MLITDSDRQYELSKKDDDWVQKGSRSPLKLTSPHLCKDSLTIIGTWEAKLDINNHDESQGEFRFGSMGKVSFRNNDYEKHGHWNMDKDHLEVYIGG